MLWSYFYLYLASSYLYLASFYCSLIMFTCFKKSVNITLINNTLILFAVIKHLKCMYKTWLKSKHLCFSYYDFNYLSIILFKLFKFKSTIAQASLYNLCVWFIVASDFIANTFTTACDKANKHLLSYCFWLNKKGQKISIKKKIKIE